MPLHTTSNGHYRTVYHPYTSASITDKHPERRQNLSAQRTHTPNTILRVPLMIFRTMTATLLRALFRLLRCHRSAVPYLHSDSPAFEHSNRALAAILRLFTKMHFRFNSQFSMDFFGKLIFHSLFQSF